MKLVSRYSCLIVYCTLHIQQYLYISCKRFKIISTIVIHCKTVIIFVIYFIVIYFIKICRKMLSVVDMALNVYKTGGSNYDSLIVRTIAFPVQVAYWTKRSWPPVDTVSLVNLTSGLETWPWGPVGWWRSLHDRVSRVPACKSSPRTKLESDRY